MSRPAFTASTLTQRAVSSARIALLALGGAALILLMLLSVADALLRTIFNAPIFGAQEISRMLLAATVAFGIPAGIMAGQAITIDIVAERMPARAARLFEKIMLLATAAAFVLVAIRCYVNGRMAARFGESTILLAIPYQPLYHCLAAGFAVAALATLRELASPTTSGT